MVMVTSSEHFNTGAFVFTQMVHYTTETSPQFEKEITEAISRYINKDWGDLREEDIAVNEEALKFPDNLYLLGAYKTCKGKVYIITNRISETAGDNATTVLFANEY